MRARIIPALAAAALLVTAVGVGSPAQAAKRPTTKNLTFEVDFVSAGTTLTSLPGGITYGWNDLQGPTTWGAKSASVRFLGNVDYVDGTGPFGGYVTVTRSDGTQLAFSVSGWATAPAGDGTSNAKFRGTITVIGGTGPYAGATGTGTMAGYRKSALGSPVELAFSVTVQQK